jgi:hypothetical protein
MRASSCWVVLAAVTAIGLTASGCDDSDTAAEDPSGSPVPPGEGPEGFISDNPNQNATDDEGGANGPVGSGTGAGDGDGDGEAGSGGGSGEPPPEEPEEDPERAIAEADIVQLHDGKLYALSRYSGLSIIDTAGPELRMLGKKALPGVPFEMYLVDGIAYTMFSEWGSYVEHDDGSWEWVNTSHLEAIDVSDPSAIATVGSFELPGFIADSRMVGDVIYAVTFEDGYCWDCGSDPVTTVTSLAVGSAEDIRQLDRLTIEEPDAYAYGWNRSITVTEDRMYIAGVEWSETDGDHSTIRVVDISDADGALRLGTTVEVEGQILSRWQMDEYEGVLRVVSQPWNSSINPSIQTFAIASADDISPLGYAELELPMPESLRATRFDGDRGFAITAVQTDPLYTIDLSDPANPRQMGELQLPGFIWHIEPRGDRLVTLGFDEGNPEGALHVSLYDVADLTAPTEIRRINFGGDWAGLSEDQNRVHKLFKVLEDLELILVPFTAWDWDDYGCGGYESGVQLIDWKDDDLAKRGVAPIRGEARRAFVEGDRLFALSDEQVRTFDFADRDEPAKNGELQLSTHVSRILLGDEHVVRLSADWWTSEPRLEITSKDDIESAEPLGHVDLGAMLADVENDQSCYSWGYWDVRMFANGDDVYLVWPSWNQSTARVAVIDASDPTKPRIASHMDVPVDVYSYGGWYPWGGGQLVSDGQPVVQLGSRLAFLEVERQVDEWGYPVWEEDPAATHGANLRVMDFSDPDAPRLASTVALPAGAGHTKLVTSGDTVMLSHWEPLAGDPSRARFYLDRVQVSEGGDAALLPKVNVPGSLVAFDAESSHLLTVDYLREVHDGLTWEQCYEQFGGNAWWEPTELDDPFGWNDGVGVCSFLNRTLRLVAVDAATSTARLLDERPLPDHVYFGQLFVADDRVFTTTQSYTDSYDDEGNYVPPQSQVWAIGGIRAGDLEVRTKSLDEVWWAYPLAARGKRLVALASPGSVVSVDATDLANLTVKKHADLSWYTETATIDDDSAYLAHGPYGITKVDLR